MDAIERIKKDLKLFAKNIKEVESIKVNDEEEKIIKIAYNYLYDT